MKPLTSPGDEAADSWFVCSWVCRFADFVDSFLIFCVFLPFFSEKSHLKCLMVGSTRRRGDLLTVRNHFIPRKFTEIYKDILIIYTIVSILTDYSGLSSRQ